MQLFRNLGECEGLRDLTLTTNATQLKKYARPLKDAGVTRINVSLDTLRPERFRDMTRVGDLKQNTGRYRRRHCLRLSADQAQRRGAAQSQPR